MQDWVSLVQIRKKFFNNQAKNLESEMTIRLCHLCSKVDRFASPIHRWVHRRCSKCGHEFGDFIPEKVLHTGSFGKPAPVQSPEKSFQKRSDLTIQILAATLGGEKFNPVGTLDVTANVERLLSEDKKTLHLEKGKNILEEIHLDIDPAPGLEKCLHIRCCFNDGVRKYEILSTIDKDNNIVDSITICMPKTPWLRILENSYYGHPSDISKRYDISEILQTIVDTEGNGCFLQFPIETDLSTYFDDPYPEGDKEMIIYYEVEGWMGHIHMNAFGGYLIDKIEIRAPVVEPQLIVMNAWWGMPTKEILDRIKEQENPFALREEMFQYHINITTGIQRLIDQHGNGKSLIIDTKDNLQNILGIDISEYQSHLKTNKDKKRMEEPGEIGVESKGVEYEDEEELEHVLYLSYSLRGREVVFIGLENLEKPGYLLERLAIICPRYKSGIVHQQLRESRKGRFVVPVVV